MTETWVLIFNVFAGTATMEGFADRQTCVDAGLRLEEAAPKTPVTGGVRWICIYKGGKP